MDSATRKAYDATRKMPGKAFPSACYAPFVSMFFTTSGNVVACCKSQNFPLGNIATERLDEIWNGARYNAMRKALEAYVIPVGCEFCDWQISGGDLKEAFTHVFDHYPVGPVDPVTDRAAPMPAVMEFAVSNSCNLECVMCCGESSSRIRARRERLPPLANVYGDVFYDDLRRYLPHLKLARFLGGEPFVTRGNYRIWDMMIGEKLNTPCLITTNGTTFDKRVERVLEHLPCSIVFSSDGATKETLEKIRVGARFEVLEENARRFIEYTRSRGTTFEFSYCLMRENWHEFGDFLRMAESHGVKVNVSTVVEPAPHSLYTLPPEQLLPIVEALDRQTPTLVKELAINREIWKGNVESLRRNANKSRVEAAMKMQPGAVLEARQAIDPSDHLGVATSLSREGRTADAIAEALKTPPTDAHHYHSLVFAANLLMETDRLEESEERASQAIKLAPTRPEAFVARAWLRNKQARIAEGIADVEAADRLLSTLSTREIEVPLLGVGGILYTKAKRLEDARRFFDRLFRDHPNHADAHVWRGWARLDEGLFKDALSDARIAMRLAPGAPWPKTLAQHAIAALGVDEATALSSRMSEAFTKTVACSPGMQSALRERALTQLRGWSGNGIDEMLTDAEDVILEIQDSAGGCVSQGVAAIGSTLDDLRGRMLEKLGRHWDVTEVEVNAERIDRILKIQDGQGGRAEVRTIILPRFSETGALLGLRVLMSMSKKATVEVH